MPRKKPGNGEQCRREFDFEFYNDEQRRAWQTIDANHVTFLTGPAGTAKTYIATAYAVNSLINGYRNSSGYKADHLVITRPSVEAGERLGFLPGDSVAKIGPYTQPVFDTIAKLVGRDGPLANQVKASVRVSPLAYMRGVTMDGSVSILDEAQNVTATQMELYLSRIGKGTKLIICGDTDQSDLRQGESCLDWTARVLNSISGVGHYHFSEGSIVRHEIISKILRRLRDARESA